MRSRWILLGGDVAAFVAFGLVGLASHEKSVALESVARSMLVFPVAWLALSPFFRTLSARAVCGELPFARLMTAWLVAGVLALGARAIIFDRELFNAFFVIALVGNGLFLAAWRAIYNHWIAVDGNVRAPANPVERMT